MKTEYHKYILRATHALSIDMRRPPDKKLADLCSAHKIIDKSEFNFLISTNHKLVLGCRSDVDKRAAINKKMYNAISNRQILFVEYEAKKKAAASVETCGLKAEVKQ